MKLNSVRKMATFVFPLDHGPVSGWTLHYTSCSSCPQQRNSRNIVCSLICHLTTLQLSISWMAVYVKYLFVLPEKCITHWWSGPPNEKEATCPKHSIEKREKKYGENVKKTVSVLMVNAPWKGKQHLLRFKYLCSSIGGGKKKVFQRERAFPGNIPAVLFSNSCSRSFCPIVFFYTSFESTAEKARNTQITWAIDVNP